LAERLRIVREVADAVGLAEGEHGVKTVISALARLEPVSIRNLSRAAELPVPIVAAICGELRKRSVVSQRRPARLTGTGRRLFSNGALGLRTRATCAACGGREIVVPDGLSALVRDIANTTRRTPPPRLDLDQCHCTVETKLRRVLALHEADALVGRRILLLGDDDLTALALAGAVRRLGSAATIAQLTVIDVDPEVIHFIRTELDGAPFPVSCLEHDLAEPLPAELLRSFDTVVTDPPFTVPAARLFLSRAVDALAGPGANVFFSFGSRRPEASFHVQQAIFELGFVIRRLIRDFNEYVGAGVLGGTSHLYHLVATSQARPTVTGRFTGPLYTSQLQA
jgi:predicted methyltransferase